MIRGINGSNFVSVSGGQMNLPYINGSALSAGQLRLNPNTQNFEVYDGTGWQSIMPAYANVDLPDYIKETITWANQKMMEERHMDELCKKYPGLDKARDNFELFKKFVQAQEQADNGHPVARSGVTTGP